MGDEIVNLHVTLVDPGTWQKAAARGGGGAGSGAGGDATFPLRSSEDLNSLVSNIRASAKEGGGVHEKEISKLKHFVRTNHWPVHHEIRSTLWQTLCNIRGKVEREPYESLCADIFGVGPNRRKDIQLPCFVSPESVLNYSLNEEGVAAAQRILCTLAYNHPEITWAPRMYPTTALLLHYMTEPQAYDCICAIYRYNKEFTHFSETKNSYQASKLVLKDLTKKYAKNVYRFILRCSAPDSPDAFFDRWMWWLFEAFPFHLVVRVMDCYLMEGSKVLYRMAIAVVIEFYKYAGRNSENLMSTSSMARAIEAFCSSNDLNWEKVFAKAFALRGFSRSEIRNVCRKNLTKVEFASEKLSKSLSLPDLPLTTFFPAGCQTLIKEQWHKLISWIPTRFTVHETSVLFTTDRDGTSLRTLYQKVEDFEPLLLLITPMDVDDAIFGAYISTSLALRRKQGRNRSFFGTGESFLFTVAPERRKFDWVGTRLGAEISLDASLFVAADDTTLIIGGGGGEGLALDEELNRGRTQNCKTFDNPPLVSLGDFNCRLVEVIGFGSRASP